MKASLRPALFIMGAVTVGGLAVLKSASASSTLVVTDAVELGHKDGGAVDLLDLSVAAHKDGGAVELSDKGGKDGGAVELAALTEQSMKGGKDAGSVTTGTADGGK
jgi:hypothetical protein